MKYKTIGAFKNVQNVPYCKAATELHVGMGVVLDRATGTASLPASDADCKAVTYIVSNIDDKPERHSSAEAFTVQAGEYVRADNLHTVNGLEIEFAAFEIDGGTEGLAAGDMLVFTTSGLVKKAADADGYAAAFKVIAKTAYMDDGNLAEIIAQ